MVHALCHNFCILWQSSVVIFHVGDVQCFGNNSHCYLTALSLCSVIEFDVPLPRRPDIFSLLSLDSDYLL